MKTEVTPTECNATTHTLTEYSPGNAIRECALTGRPCDKGGKMTVNDPFGTLGDLRQYAEVREAEMKAIKDLYDRYVAEALDPHHFNLSYRQAAASFALALAEALAINSADAEARFRKAELIN